jgi:release factor glutamine methyltransferase
MNAELLLMFTLSCDRAYLYAHPERELTADESSRYQSALAERARGVPAQYITGHQEFWGMDFVVNPAVLIPRPETEHVVETALELMGGGHSCPPTLAKPASLAVNSSAALPRTMRIADVGTGSGCIALAMAKELPHAEIHATDISPTALEVARANAARHQLQVNDRVQFHQTDLLEGLSPPPFDLVVSNPPYVGDSEEDHVQLEVRKFEPRDAVFAGPTGVEVIARLIPQAYAALRPGGWLVMEISGTIADRTKLMLDGWDAVRITRDLQSIPRIARAQKPQR